MAKLSAHGTVIGTVDYLDYSKRYMSDGVVLKNHGQGWKLAGKVKPDVRPMDAYQRAKASLDAILANRPATATYRVMLHDLTSMCNRWRLHAAVKMMPDDPDGVWSDACDGYGGNVHADLDDIVELCRLYGIALREQRDVKAGTALQTAAVMEVA